MLAFESRSALVSMWIVDSVWKKEITGHECAMGAIQLEALVNDLARTFTICALENTISRAYHVQGVLCWWSRVGGFQKAERRTDDEVELVPLKKR